VPTPAPVEALEPVVAIDIPGADRAILNGTAIYVQSAHAVHEIDPGTNAVRTVVDDLGERWSFHVAYESLWVSRDAGDRGLVERYDLESGEALAVIEVGLVPVEMVGAFDSIWTINHRSSSVSRIDLTTNAATTIAVETRFDPIDVAAADARIWAVSPHGYRLTGIDAATNEVVSEVNLIAEVCGVRYRFERLWVRACRTAPTFIYDEMTGELLGRWDPFPVGVGPVFWAARPLRDQGFALGRYDPATLELLAEGGMVGNPVGATIGFGSAWVPSEDQILRYDLAALGG
jgi:hypothetical protein